MSAQLISGPRRAGRVRFGPLGLYAGYYIEVRAVEQRLWLFGVEFGRLFIGAMFTTDHRS